LLYVPICFIIILSTISNVILLEILMIHFIGRKVFIIHYAINLSLILLLKRANLDIDLVYILKLSFLGSFLNFSSRQNVLRSLLHLFFRHQIPIHCRALLWEVLCHLSLLNIVAFIRVASRRFLFTQLICIRILFHIFLCE